MTQDQASVRLLTSWQQPNRGLMTAIPAGLPSAQEAIAAVRSILRDGGTVEDASRMLDQYTPAIDELADAEASAAWLGLTTGTVYQERSRTRAAGIAGWPDADLTAGRSGLWRYRTLVLHRAAMPGRGSAGRGRPARRT
jgi:hypothetical protein